MGAEAEERGPRRIARSPVALLLAFVASVLVIAAAPAPTTAASPLRFEVSLDHCFSVHGPPATPIKLTWRDATGRLKSRFQLVSDALGWVPGAVNVCSPLRVTSGDRITATVGADSRTFKVPRLAAVFDRASATLHGLTSPGAHLTVYLSFPHPFFNPASLCKGATIAVASGAYALDLHATSDLFCPSDAIAQGGEFVSVGLADARGDQTDRTALATTVSVTAGSARVTGALDPGRAMTIALRDPAAALLGKAHVTGRPDGTFTARFLDPAGHPVKVGAGDVVSGGWSGPIALTVPAMSFAVSTLQHTVAGHCMPNAPYAMELEYTGGPLQAHGTTDAGGVTPSVSASLSVLNSATLKLTCRYPGGDLVNVSSVP